MTQHTHPDSGSTTAPSRTAHRAAPQAASRPIERTLHGDTVVARYRWLRDRRSPEVAAHLAAENAFTDSATAHLGGLTSSIADSLSRLRSDIAPSVPVRDGGWWYLDRGCGEDDFTLSRVEDRVELQGPDGIPVLREGELLDGEEMLLEDRRFVVGVAVSPDHALLARAEARVGGCTITVTDAATGAVVDRSLHGVGPDLVFSADGSCLLYTSLDDLGRRHQVLCHALGTPVEEDSLLFEEPDDWADLDLARSRSGSALLIRSTSPTASEVWMVDLATGCGEPRSVTGHRADEHPVVEHAGDRLLVIRRDRSGRSVLFETSLETTDALPDGTPLLTARDGEEFESAEAFAAFVAVQVRADGLPAVRLIPRRTDGSLDVLGVRELGEHGELTSVRLDANPDWHQSTVRCRLDSFLTPTTIVETDVATGRTTTLTHPQVSGIDLDRFVEKRLWAESPDGTRVPISVVARRDVPLDGTAAGMLYGDGAYGASTDPLFSSETLALADRGLVVATAHVRGGGEMGVAWHEQGRLHAKGSSIDDFVACADHLISTGWVAADRLGSVGTGAGGLLVGAAANRAPERFRAVLAGTPLVDPLETMLDPEVMLTLAEWAEWGDPAGSEADYQSLKACSPSENVRETAYPAIFAWTAMRGTDVPAACAAIWIATLRDRVTSDLAERPILLRCTTTLDEVGDPRLEGVAWLLDQLGATSLEG